MQHVPAHPPSGSPPSSLPSRRRFLAAGAATAGLLVAARLPSALAAPSSSLDNPFTLGVASGEPDANGVVLWTRLAPQPLLPDGGMPARPIRVEWELAADPRMRKIVRRGDITARPEHGHSVHVEVAGLEPASTYWYRFRAAGEVSPPGRTRTTPSRHDDPRHLAFAFTSCQNYEQGYYTAYRHIAEEELDFVLHLGDYIYEGNPRDGQPRKHVGAEPTDLASYRVRHALYRSDADLQAAHAAAPFVVTWDDHEVDNDYADEHSQDFDDPAVFLRRRSAAYQAYYEHLPLRRQSHPKGPGLSLYRRFAFGDLAQFSVLDTRQYRDDQACPDGEGGGQEVTDCPELADPSRTILGAKQRRWLLDGLDRSSARWNVIAQQLLMAELDEQPGPGVAYWTDGWDGYAADRARILRFLQEREPSNPVVLGGDIHSFWVTDLKPDNRDPASPVVASEFVGTSISSSGVPFGVFSAFLPDNPHIKYFESRLRGYVRCTVTPKRWTSDLRVVDTVATPGAPVRTLASFVVEDGRPGPVAA
jgi:alkaline phosphatase D